MRRRFLNLSDPIAILSTGARLVSLTDHRNSVAIGGIGAIRAGWIRAGGIFLFARGRAVLVGFDGRCGGGMSAARANTITTQPNSSGPPA